MGRHEILTMTFIETNQKDSRSVHAMGVKLMNGGDLRQAESWLRRAVDLDPTDFDFLHDLSTVLRSQGRFDESRAILDNLMLQTSSTDSAFAAVSLSNS